MFCFMTISLSKATTTKKQTTSACLTGKLFHCQLSIHASISHHQKIVYFFSNKIKRIIYEFFCNKRSISLLNRY